MGIRSVDFNNINLGNATFYDDNLETMIHARLVAWCNKYKQRKVFKKRVKHEIHVCNMASKKILGLVCARRQRERNRTIFFNWWKVVKMCSIFKWCYGLGWYEWRFSHNTDQIIILSKYKKFFVKYKFF